MVCFWFWYRFSPWGMLLRTLVIPTALPWVLFTFLRHRHKMLKSCPELLLSRLLACNYGLNTPFSTENFQCARVSFSNRFPKLFRKSCIHNLSLSLPHASPYQNIFSQRALRIIFTLSFTKTDLMINIKICLKHHRKNTILSVFKDFFLFWMSFIPQEKFKWALHISKSITGV